jgi:hypothetical protein
MICYCCYYKDNSKEYFVYDIKYENLLNDKDFNVKYLESMNEFKKTKFESSADKQAIASELLVFINDNRNNPEFIKEKKVLLRKIFSQSFDFSENKQDEINKTIVKLKKFIMDNGMSVFISNEDNKKFVLKRYSKDPNIFSKNIIKIGNDKFRMKYVHPVFFQFITCLKNKEGIQWAHQVIRAPDFTGFYSNDQLIGPDPNVPLKKNESPFAVGGTTYKLSKTFPEYIWKVFFAYISEKSRLAMETTIPEWYTTAYYAKEILKNFEKIENPEYSCCESCLTLILDSKLNPRIHKFITAMKYFPLSEELYVVEVPIAENDFKFGEYKKKIVRTILNNKITEPMWKKCLKIFYIAGTIFTQTGKGYTRILYLGNANMKGYATKMTPSLFKPKCDAFEIKMPQYLNGEIEKMGKTLEDFKKYILSFPKDNYIRLALEIPELALLKRYIESDKNFKEDEIQELKKLLNVD